MPEPPIERATAFDYMPVREFRLQPDPSETPIGYKVATEVKAEINHAVSLRGGSILVAPSDSDSGVKLLASPGEDAKRGGQHSGGRSTIGNDAPRRKRGRNSVSDWLGDEETRASNDSVSESH